MKNKLNNSIMEYMNNKTRWVVKINDQKTKRVLIEYFPLENKFVFSGQLKVAEIWYNFSKKEILLGKEEVGFDELNGIAYKIINTTVDSIDIDDNILNVYTELEDKVAIHISFSERMEEYRDSTNNKNFACKIADESETNIIENENERGNISKQ